MELDKSDSVDSAIGIVEKQKLMLKLKQIPTLQEPPYSHCAKSSSPLWEVSMCISDILAQFVHVIFRSVCL